MCTCSPSLCGKDIILHHEMYEMLGRGFLKLEKKSPSKFSSLHGAHCSSLIFLGGCPLPLPATKLKIWYFNFIPFSPFLAPILFVLIIPSLVRLINTQLRTKYIAWSLTSVIVVRAEYSDNFQSSFYIVDIFFWEIRNWVFATNSNFLIPISIEPDVVDFWYFKLR